LANGVATPGPDAPTAAAEIAGPAAGSSDTAAGDTAAGRPADTAGPGADPHVDGAVARRAEPEIEPVTGPIVRLPSAEVEPASRTLATRPDAEVTPSWGQVLSTTMRLWAQRRSRRWRLVTALLVLIAVFAAGALTVALVRQPGSRSASGQAASGPAQPGSASVAAATAARRQAATWIAAQISHGTVVSCDPAMCAALETDGFPSGALMTIGPSAGYPLGSSVIVATAAVRSDFGDRLTSVYAPTVLASFGSGSARVDVREYAPGGAAAFLPALKTDQLARQSAGRQLLRNRHVSAAPAARQQLAAGQVDARLLITFATLAAQGRVHIVAFSDSGPGADPGVPLRAAELARPRGTKNSYLRSVLALLRAQQGPYLANTITLATLANGQQVVRLEYAAPSPLGLLSG
jgi:hypothetical protein